MAETAKEKLRAKATTGSDLRDIASAWIVCALIAAMALALSGQSHPAAPAPIATALTQRSR
jgi:hypothetical protein